MKPQLLCTFTLTEQLPNCVGNINKAYNNDVANLNYYCYVADISNAICVYNVFSTDRKVKDTISINRKKETNTLYSINALNAIIRSVNNGILDKTFVIDWAQYVDCLILSENNGGFKTIKIKELSF